MSQIDPTAWQNLVGRYDGQTLSIFCNGRLMSSQSLTGSIIPNSHPLIIGAKIQNGKPAHHFHGELDEAAIWNRALNDSEIERLNPL